MVTSAIAVVPDIPLERSFEDDEGLAMSGPRTVMTEEEDKEFVPDEYRRDSRSQLPARFDILKKEK